MQKERFLALLVLLTICFCLLSSSANALEINNSTAIFEANIFAPEQRFVEIQIPDRIFFGNLTIGEMSEEVKVNINNTGNIDVAITPELSPDYTGEIFNHTYFKRVLTDDLVHIGDYSFNISASTDNKYFYAVLDLREFDGELEEDLIGHNAEIVFWAIENEA